MWPHETAAKWTCRSVWKKDAYAGNTGACPPLSKQTTAVLRTRQDALQQHASQTQDDAREGAHQTSMMAPPRQKSMAMGAPMKKGMETALGSGTNFL